MARIVVTSINNNRVVTSPQNTTKVVVTYGAIGPAGAQGPPGTGVEALWQREDDEFPETIGGIEAGSTFANNTNAIQILEQLLYPYQVVDFTNFSDGLSTYYEIGQTAGNQTAFFTWNTTGPASNWVADSVSISSSESGVIISGLDYNQSPQSYAHPPYRKTSVSSVTFTITGEQAEGSDASATTSLLWRYTAFCGRAGTDGSPATLGGGSDLSSFTKTHPITTIDGWQPSIGAASPVSYVYFVYPTALVGGTPVLTDITNPAVSQTVPITLGAPFSYTNEHGVAIDYTYFRTTNALGGAIDFQVDI